MAQLKKINISGKVVIGQACVPFPLSIKNQLWHKTPKKIDTKLNRPGRSCFALSARSVEQKLKR